MTANAGTAVIASTDTPPASMRMAYRQRLSAALRQLDERGAQPHIARPPLFRMLRRLALPVRPPLYLGLLGATLYYAAALVPAIGLLLWLLVWRHDSVSPLRILPSVVQIALVPSVAMALLTRLRAWRLKLDRWQRLDESQTAAVTSVRSHDDGQDRT